MHFYNFHFIGIYLLQNFYNHYDFVLFLFASLRLRDIVKVQGIKVALTAAALTLRLSHLDHHLLSTPVITLVSLPLLQIKLFHLSFHQHHHYNYAP